MAAIISALDHIVLVCATLDDGLDNCQKVLGVRPTPGGEHTLMGTHNHLLNLGGGVYLEVMAINPLATPVKRKRWSGMDDPAQQLHARRSPYLASFVVHAGSIGKSATALLMLGPICAMQRGLLHWQITVRDDGALLENGMLPSVIQWPRGVEPTQNMPDLGCRLVRLDVCHPQPEKLAALWKKIGLHSSDVLNIQTSEPGAAPYLVAHIDTLDGMRTIPARL